MTQWQPLSRQTHANACYRPRWDFNHARERSLVPAMQGELAKLIPHYVLAFIKEQGEYRPMTLLAAPGQGNLYLREDGKWAAPYVPAALRAHPFALLRAEGKEDLLMAVDENSLKEPGNGEPLFDDQGALTDGVQRAMDFLGQMETQKKHTEQAVAPLQAAGVIQPWALSLPVNGEMANVKGLYCIDEQVLNRLDSEAYARLQGAPMQLAYAQLYSMAQLDQLKHRAELHQQQTSGHHKEVDLEDLFGEDDDTFKFNF